MLSNPYYIGKIRHRGVIYDGAHEPLIDDDAWYQVQNLLSGRRLAGDRSWKHEHPLKGLLVCGRCEGRMGYGHSKGRGGVYSYFFCLGRHTGRTNCDLPYVPVESVEQAMQEEWNERVQFSPEEITRTREEAHRLLETESTESSKLHDAQKKRLRALQLRKQRLIDAYLDGALEAADIRPRQEQVAAEIADAERLIRNASTDGERVRGHVDLVLKLMETAGDLYRNVADPLRRDLNQAVFECVRVDVLDNEGEALEPPEKAVALAAEFSPPVAAIAELGRPGVSTPKVAHVARRSATRGNSGRGASSAARGGQNKTPGKLSLTGGSNLYLLAVTVGFEPTVGGYPTRLFESRTFGRSDTSPRKSLRDTDEDRESAAVSQPRRDGSATVTSISMSVPSIARPVTPMSVCAGCRSLPCTSSIAAVISPNSVGCSV